MKNTVTEIDLVNEYEPVVRHQFRLRPSTLDSWNEFIHGIPNNSVVVSAALEHFMDEVRNERIKIVCGTGAAK